MVARATKNKKKQTKVKDPYGAPMRKVDRRTVNKLNAGELTYAQRHAIDMESVKKPKPVSAAGKKIAKTFAKKIPYVGTALGAYDTGKAAIGAVKRTLANKAAMKPAKKSKGSTSKNFDKRLKRK